MNVDSNYIPFSTIEDKVCEKIQSRRLLGLKKYGVSMERKDLTRKEWLIHLQEELMDALIYSEKEIQNEIS